MDSVKIRKLEESPEAWDALGPLRKAVRGRGGDDVRVRWLEGTDLPAAFAPILDHDKDMTSTLARHHQDAIGVTVLGRQQSKDVHWREVILQTANGGKNLIYGCVSIRVDLLDAKIRSALCEEKEPLGTILSQAGYPLKSQVRGFFSISGPVFERLIPFGCGERSVYGRCSNLMIPGKRIVAHVVEVILSNADADE